MKKILAELPPALLRQIYIRAGTSILSFILFIVVAIFFHNIYLYVPCLILFAVMIVNTATLVYNCVTGNYIKIEGLCSNVEATKIKRKTKSIELKFEEHTLKFPINKRIGKINLGDTIIVYLSDKTLVYEKDGIYVVYEYYAIEVKERNYEFTKRKIV